jgi:hypothetical protein
MNAATFAPKALRRAAPKLVDPDSERRREFAEHAEKSIIFCLCGFCGLCVPRDLLSF